METTQVTTTVVTMLWYHWVLYIIVATLGAMASSLVVNKGKFILPQLPKPNSASSNGNPPEGSNTNPGDKAQIMGFGGILS